MSIVDRAPWLTLNDAGDDILDELERLLHRPAWQADALCKEPSHAHISWHPGRGEDTRPAKAVCGRCLVREECLAFALEHENDGGNTRVGIWGGLSARERNAMTERSRRRRSPKPDGYWTLERVAEAVWRWLDVNDDHRLAAYTEALGYDDDLPRMNKIVEHFGGWRTMLAAWAMRPAA